MKDTTFPRSVKLTGVALVIAIALGAAGFVLPDHYRWLMWGGPVGLLATMLVFTTGAYRRRSISVPMSRIDREKEKKAQKWTAAVIVIAAGLAGTVTHLVVGDAAQMFFLGAAFGVAAAAALILSPLFYNPASLQQR